jgi:hypothetical protein
MITAAFVRDCKPRAKMYEVTCDALPGFILRVLPTGKKVALVRYRVDGKDHREKLGMLGPGAVDRRGAAPGRRRARKRCRRARASPLRPSPPPTATPARLVQPEPPAVAGHLAAFELAERFVRTHVDVHLKPGTAERYRQQLAVEILPKLGDRDFRSIKRADVQELHAGMKEPTRRGEQHGRA